MAVVSLKNIHKSYGDLKVIEGISLDVKQGDILALLGVNGAGKTTAMGILSGYIKPDQGTVEICGYNISKNRIDAQKMIGYAPEGEPLYKDMKVKEFLAFSGAMRGMKSSYIRSRVDSLVEDLDLHSVYNRLIGNLSKGYKRRVLIAHALLHDPEVLILDEPTDGLDPIQKAYMHKFVKQVSQKKLIIISTHVLEEMQSLCNRVAILNNRKIVVDKSLQDIIFDDKKYLNMEATVVSSGDIQLFIDHLKQRQNIADVTLLDHYENIAKLSIIPRDKRSLSLLSLANRGNSNQELFIQDFIKFANSLGFMIGNISVIDGSLTRVFCHFVKKGIGAL